MSGAGLCPGHSTRTVLRPAALAASSIDVPALIAAANSASSGLWVTRMRSCARAVAAIKRNHAPQSACWLLVAILTGVGFLIVKYFEYGAKFSAGINLETNLFYTFYISLTMFHAMHVVLGMAILFFVWKKAVSGGYSAHDHHGMETGASYWHMVDLVWIILFPLVYVMR